MFRFASQKGAITIGGLIFWLVVGIAGYVGMKMSAPLIKNYQVKELFRNKVAALKTHSEEIVREDTYKKLNELNVKLYVDYEVEDDGLHILLEEGKPAIMDATFIEEVTFIGGYIYIYSFNPRMESSAIVNPR